VLDGLEIGGRAAIGGTVKVIAQLPVMDVFASMIRALF